VFHQAMMADKSNLEIPAPEEIPWLHIKHPQTIQKCSLGMQYFGFSPSKMVFKK
jgi:hypothetical protein